MIKKVITTAIALGMILSVGASSESFCISRNITAAAEDTFTSGSYKYLVLSDNTLQITKYLGSDTAPKIPSSAGGKAVTKIGRAAFEGCTEIKSITIPEGIVSIGNGAFYRCSSLTDIMIPQTVTDIGYEVFSDCESLTEINAEKGNNVYSTENGILFNKSKTTLICCPAGKTDAVIPQGVREIADHSFWGCKKLTTLGIPEGVDTIGELALSGCTGLKEISIPQSVVTIGQQAFGYDWGEKIDSFRILCYPGSAGEKYAQDNGFEYVLFDTPVHKHSYTGKVTKQATCKNTGIKTYTCSCGDSYTELIALASHTFSSKVTKPTYKTQGYTTHTCSVCSYSCKDSYKDKLRYTSIKKAVIKAIPDKVYTGKAVKPAVTIKLGEKTLKKNTDYTIAYKNNKAVGKATVTIKGKGAYSGSVTKSFRILPKKTAIKKVTSPKSKKLKVTYKKVSGVSGYQVTYSTSKKFRKSVTKTVNTKKTSKTIGKLKKGRSYFVRVRTYKTVSGKKYYSAYTKVKKIKIK